MKKLTILFVIFVLGFNIFGAYVGQVSHSIIHWLSEDHHEAHDHKSIAAALSYTDIDLPSAENDDHHEHTDVLKFLLNAFQVKELDDPLSGLMCVNILMITLDCVFSDSIFKITKPISGLVRKYSLAQLYTSVFHTIIVPPPKVLV